MILAVFVGKFSSPRFRIDCARQSLEDGQDLKKLFAIDWAKHNDLY